MLSHKHVMHGHRGLCLTWRYEYQNAQQTVIQCTKWLVEQSVSSVAKDKSWKRQSSLWRKRATFELALQKTEIYEEIRLVLQNVHVVNSWRTPTTYKTTYIYHDTAAQLYD